MWTYDSYIDMIDAGMKKDTDLYLRHDVDISLDKALEMAELESTRQFHATYYILLSSPFYNALEPNNLEKIRMIRNCGMAIGLHYDLSIKPEMSVDWVVKEIIVQLGLMVHHVGEMNTVTFHKPAFGKSPTKELYTELFKEGIFCPDNADHKYISDSGHNWREDYYEVIKNNKQVHMNTHPEWYNDEEQDMETCLDMLNIDKKYDSLIQWEKRNIKEYIHNLS